ncbi:hypothetical protein C0Q70_08882 [Pomacea canaliculata]|uniref:Uncharacterized protein n=1 Tax=Pomacea canaliculata TaxID=400727 RepID=A0A2T7P871_POMCA|nr:hypothetical protein C0Q70_08882 [Pomacea canaliculata]
MVLTRDSAFGILQLPKDADKERVKAKYKQLAFKWHPEKHSNSPESVKQFKQITQAYRLLAFSDPQDMTMAEARQLFSDTYFSNSCVLNGGVCDDSTSSDDDSDDSDDFYTERVNAAETNKDNANERTDGSQLTAEEAERNGDDLTEEERERRKAEKRRLKKKRRKERKKLEKQEQHKQEKGKNQKNKANSQQEKNKKSEKKPASDSTSDEQAEFDPESAFFTKAVSKKKKSSNSSKKDKMSERNGAHNGEDEIEEVDSTVLRSRQLANPKDFRFLGNRSYCYDRQQQYEKALKDAEKAIKLAKEWPKGYFRKGRALSGLNRFPEAEEAFLQVLKLDKSCEEAVHELELVRVRQLTDMGFTLSQASAAIKKYATVQTALESLLTGADDSLAGELYISDEEDFAPPKHISVPKSVLPQTSDTKMDPKNPEGLTALWVGNVLPQVTERRLTQLFSKYGPVVSVRLLPEKYCAFVNFKLKESAGKAMQFLQGFEIEGQRLLIRFPDNPINNSGSITLRKSTPTTTPVSATIATSAKPSQAKGVRNMPKMSGPVNGDECYFWRTTGCDYGDACRYRHVPQSKGVDKKPWQK